MNDKLTIMGLLVMGPTRIDRMAEMLGWREQRVVDAVVYVTGPHFSQDIFSSTEDRAKASRFGREVAERYLALGKWRGCNPRIEDD